MNAWWTDTCHLSSVQITKFHNRISKIILKNIILLHVIPNFQILFRKLIKNSFYKERKKLWYIAILNAVCTAYNSCG